MYCDECLIRNSIKVVKFENPTDLMGLCKECITTFSESDYKVILCEKCNSEDISFDVLNNNGKTANVAYECKSCESIWTECIHIINN